MRALCVYALCVLSLQAGRQLSNCLKQCACQLAHAQIMPQLSTLNAAQRSRVQGPDHAVVVAVKEGDVLVGCWQSGGSRAARS